jgi:hypothetical protein
MTFIMAAVKQVVEVWGISPVKTISHFPGRKRSWALREGEMASAANPIDSSTFLVVMGSFETDLSYLALYAARVDQRPWPFRSCSLVPNR